MPQPFIRKTAIEEVVIGLDFTDEVPAGTEIDTCACSARVRRTEADATSVILASGTDAVVDAVANTAKITVNGGVRGTMYEVIFTATLDDAQTIAGKHLVMVDE